MNRVPSIFERMAGPELQRVIEPLASYICATESPETALKTALALLRREIAATNHSARRHFRACPQN